jgi:asparagine synthase (glutamine-hydrolysing)
VLDDLERVVRQHDEPFTSTSVFAPWFVMKRASQDGVKVILDGQGADELMAGYFSFFNAFLMSLIISGHWNKARREIMAWNDSHGIGGFNLFAFLSSAAIRMFPPKVTSGIINVARYNGSSFLKSSFIKNNQTHPPRITPSYKDPLKYELHRAIKFGLSPLLKYEDRNSMAWSIEARVPFLDHHLVEYLFALPNNQIINHGTTKVILRRAMRGIIPDVVRLRQEKLGFNTPKNNWLKHDLRPLAESIFSSPSFSNREIFEAENVRGFYAAFLKDRLSKQISSATIWRWINIEIWFRNFIDRPF